MDIDYEIIEKYVAGQLNSDELSDFKKKLETNKEFKQEVELYIEINKSLTNKYSNLQKEKELKNTLEKLGNKHFKEQNLKKEKEQKPFPLKKYILQLSSIAALLLVGFFLLKPQQDLYNEFAEHSPLEIQVKGDNDSNLLDATNYFNNKKYSEAIPLFEKYLIENPEDTEIKMSLGISLLEENKVDEAITIFKKIKDKDGIFKNKANWYLALSNLKNKNYSKTKEYLKQIPKNSFYYKKALKLNSKLD